MSTSAVRVAILNDFEIVVAGIAAVLQQHDDKVEVVELDSKVPVVSEVDVVLYDTFGQVQGGDIEVNRWITPGSAKFVVFSWNVDLSIVEAALAAGVDGYVSKGVSGADLADALRRIHAGERVTPEADHQPEGDDFGAWPGAELGLSAREAEVLGLICQGLSNDDISRRAFIGINTVKTYIRTLYRKIGVDSRTKAVLWGIDHGFRPSVHRAVADGDVDAEPGADVPG